jgi:hypothetical protein
MQSFLISSFFPLSSMFLGLPYKSYRAELLDFILNVPIELIKSPNKKRKWRQRRPTLPASIPTLIEEEKREKAALPNISHN